MCYILYLHVEVYLQILICRICRSPLQGWIRGCLHNAGAIHAPALCLCAFVYVQKAFAYVWRKGLYELVCAASQILCVCVCAFPGGGRRGQFAAGDQRKKWRKREGNDEGLLSETAKLPLSLYHPVWKLGKTHKHIGCCCWLPYKTQDLRHRMINKEHGEQIELKRTQSERQQEKKGRLLCRWITSGKESQRRKVNTRSGK